MSSKFPDETVHPQTAHEFPPDPMYIAKMGATNFLKRVTMATTPGVHGSFSLEAPDWVTLMVAAIDLETDIRLIAEGKEPHDSLPAAVKPFDGPPLPDPGRHWAIPTVNAMIIRAQAILTAATDPTPIDPIPGLREYIMLRRQLRNFLDGI
jgi:hypothetical protein